MKRKVVIIGGGMAGLAAAFDLTRTKALRDQFDVTIYQLGWRLGGKAASGRLPDGRIVEHGLHVWFGCYENAFELVRAAYDEWRPKKGQAITTWKDAFEEHRVAVIGSGDRPGFSAVVWPTTDGSPGDGGPPITFWSCVAQLLSVIEAQYQRLMKRRQIAPPPNLRIPFDIAQLLADAKVAIDGSSSGGPQDADGQFVPFDESLKATKKWAASLTQNHALRTERHLRGFARHLRGISSHLWDNQDFRSHTDGRFLQDLVDVGTALIKGVILDMALLGTSVAELDTVDFRDWLCGAGAHREAVFGSSIVHSIYDTTFQYCDGDKRRPSFGAGTAAQVSLRLFGGYRDAFIYGTNAGLGEVVVVPIYEVLRKRGVRFQFFHKLTKLELNEAGNGVAQIHFDRQVNLSGDTYEPTIEPKPQFGNLEYWPEAPRWDQIRNGKLLKGLDLESYWCRQKAGELTLHQGADFDEVVLAIPVGAFKPLNDATGPCAQLIDASRRFKKMTDAASLVPTISVQAWCTRTLKEMGWPPPIGPVEGKAIDFPMSTGPSPLNIWGDRTIVLRRERRTRVKPAPKSLQYLCDAFETSLYKASPDSSDVPKTADDHARRLAIDWFKQKSRVLWPLASPHKVFDWRLLFDPKARTGARRLDYQVVKPNVDPWACCAGSPAGSTQWRLPADGSGFTHLFLAGAWIDSGFNVECIEAAVMSGRQAARAITGSNVAIEGETFLYFERSLVGLVAELALEGVAVAERILGLAL